MALQSHRGETRPLYRLGRPLARRGGMPLGSLTAGTIASVASAPVVLMGAGVLLMALSVWYLTQSHGLKEL